MDPFLYLYFYPLILNWVVDDEEEREGQTKPGATVPSYPAASWDQASERGDAVGRGGD